MKIILTCWPEIAQSVSYKDVLSYASDSDSERLKLTEIRTGRHMLLWSIGLSCTKPTWGINAPWTSGSVPKHPVIRGLGLKVWSAEIESWPVTKSLLQPINITLCNASPNFTLTWMLHYGFLNNLTNELLKLSHAYQLFVQFPTLCVCFGLDLW